MRTIELAILDTGLDDPQWPAGFEQALQLLSQRRALGARLTLAGEDIDEWDWATQAITLSDAATARLLAALPADEELSDDVRHMKAMHEQLGWGNPIGLRLQARGFLVSLQGAALYGGVFLEAVSERSVAMPVLRSSIVNGRAVLRVLPVHLPFLSVDPGVPEREITIDDVAPEARQDWPIVQMMAREAYGPEAVRLRAIVRDDRLLAALRQA